MKEPINTVHIDEGAKGDDIADDALLHRTDLQRLEDLALGRATLVGTTLREDEAISF